MSTPVTGANNPNTPTVDVAAVQNAIKMEGQVSGGVGEVVLRGTFFFGSGTVVVDNLQRPIIIRADSDDLAVGKHPVINGGGRVVNELDVYPVLDIIAKGQQVTIQDLHFHDSNLTAIRVQKVNNLTVKNCKILGVIAAIVNKANERFVSAQGILATGTDISGLLLLDSNEISVGADIEDPKLGRERTIGIVVLQAGTQGGGLDVRITRNQINTVTAFGVDFRDIVGNALIEKNIITMGDKGASKLGFQVSGIRCSGPGNYAVKGNTINCGFENAAGIRLQRSTFIATTQIGNAKVDANLVTMSIPQGKVAGDINAGIEFRGKCLSNTASNNKIFGTARAALSLVVETASGSPDLNQLLSNDIQSFTAVPSLTEADILVGEGVSNTTIVGQETPKPHLPPFRATTIFDGGTGTQMSGNFSVVG